MQQKQELKGSHQATTQKRVLIQLSTRAFGQFVEWKGSWGQGRAFVESKTDACVSNRVVESKTDVCVSNRGFHKQGFLISGDEMAVQKAINMIATQSLTAVASPQDCSIEITDKTSRRELKAGRQARTQKKVLIRLSKRAFGQFVEWKGSWGQGRAFVESMTGALVKNRGGRFLIFGDELTVVQRDDRHPEPHCCSFTT